MNEVYSTFVLKYETKFDIKEFLRKKKAERDARMTGGGLLLNLSDKNSCNFPTSLQHCNTLNTSAHGHNLPSEEPATVMRPSDVPNQITEEDSGKQHSHLGL